MYRWIVAVHVLSALAFFAAHGVSVFVVFRLRSTDSVDGVTALLRLSRTSLGVVHLTVTLVLLTGIAAGIDGGWLSYGWFWTALATMFGLALVMIPLGTTPFNRVRRAICLPTAGIGAQKATRTEPDIIEMRAALVELRPTLLLTVGLGGAGLLVWLMMLKPF